MKKTLDFLRGLQENNNREWFEAHRDTYLTVKAATEHLAARLIEGIASFDDSVSGLTPRDCTYRIYRDIRFSHDKRPYKSHIGIYVCPGGKKSGHAGYYLHIEPEHAPAPGGSAGGCLLAAGLYMPPPAVLHSVREEMLFNGEAFIRNLKRAEGFAPDTTNSLKRVPTGFPADCPCAEYLKLKDVFLERPVSEAFMLADDMPERAVELFRTTTDFNRQLNRAIDYALETM
ncbi:MAG TPA: DUF2461 domain-containing protein [Candidatus Tidjanibacter gallistercoris]|nr:DUF2461 domain-containing protein [Candidatus Tidjanibacter gallistercoris]